MDKEYWISWLKSAWSRCIRTVAQTAIAAIGTAAILSEVDVRYVLSAAALAGILSLLTSLAGLPEVDEAEEIEDEGIEDLIAEEIEDVEEIGDAEEGIIDDPIGDDIGEEM